MTLSLNSNMRAFIFDLGGVLLNIDFLRTQKAFSELGMEQVDLLFSQYQQAGFFDQLDRGMIDEHELWKNLRQHMACSVSDEQLKDAWNQMILDFPVRRIRMLLQLKKKFKVFLLSNTNIIHYRLYNQQVSSLGFGAMDSLFHRAYYSFREGLRKPEKEFFLKVLNENNLHPGQTIFFDDTYVHTDAASELGINTCLVDKNDEISEIVKRYF